jgi:TonB family protein
MQVTNSNKLDFVISDNFISFCLAISFFVHSLALIAIFANNGAYGGGYKNGYEEITVFMLGNDVAIIGGIGGVNTDVVGQEAVDEKELDDNQKEEQTKIDEDKNEYEQDAGEKVVIKRVKKDQTGVKKQVLESKKNKDEKRGNKKRKKTLAKTIMSMQKGVGKGSSLIVVAKGSGGMIGSGGGRGNKVVSAYLYKLQRYLQANIVYPNMAKNLNKTGVVVFELEIDKNGYPDLKKLVFVKKSGESVLDEGALETIEKNIPFPKPPFDGIKIEIPIKFEIKR